MSETRFAFGENWASFLNHLDEDRIDQACRSLTGLLCLDDATGRPLDGQRFLDLGSGSGLFSLAAYRLGATVVSIDFDHHSVACTEQLRQRESADPIKWEILQGSALDESLMESLGQFDVVYSWGVLHHTGQMDRAIELAAARVAVGGQFAIAMAAAAGVGWASRRCTIDCRSGRAPFGSRRSRRGTNSNSPWPDWPAGAIRCPLPIGGKSEPIAACRRGTIGSTGSAGCPLKSPNPKPSSCRWSPNNSS